MKIAHFGLQDEQPFLESRLANFANLYFQDTQILPYLSEILDCHVLDIFINSKVDRQIIEQLPNLKLIVTRSTGYDHIDLDICAEKQITVSNVPSYGENTVAEHTFALLLALIRHIPKQVERSLEKNFTYKDLLGLDLQGKTFGIIGAGKIGLHTARIARGFGMKVIVYDVIFRDFLAQTIGFEYVSLDDLLSQSQVISLHTPLNKYTRHILDAKAFDKMQSEVILLNTSRGGLIDINALLQNLQTGKVWGAGLDVAENEEKVFIGEKDSVFESLMQHPRVLFTPHIAYYTKEAKERILETTVSNILNFEKGLPGNQV